MSIPDNRVLGEKYRLIRQLDAGGMGSVWFAEHLSLHSPVAVKLLGSEFAATDGAAQRFLHEACATASLRSPHVVQILDYGVQRGTPFIVMELLDGETLAQRLRRERRLTPTATELVIRHVCRAIARAHGAEIVHRDLKPSNIFIVRNEEEDLIKLLDFGIAKVPPALTNSPRADRTRTGVFLGSPVYASPEQAEGVTTIDYRTDLWSLGVIAFECLVGRPPFMGETFGALLLEICSRALPVPSEHAPVPPGFDVWFARACHRDPRQRFQSAREAATEFARCVREETSEREGTLPVMRDAASLESAAPPQELLQTESSKSWDSPLEPAAHPRVGTNASRIVPELQVTTSAASSSAVTRRPVRRYRRAAVAAAFAVFVALLYRGASRSEPAALLGASAAEPDRALGEMSTDHGSEREAHPLNPAPTAVPTPAERVSGSLETAPSRRAAGSDSRVSAANLTDEAAPVARRVTTGVTAVSGLSPAVAGSSAPKTPPRTSAKAKNKPSPSAISKARIAAPEATPVQTAFKPPRPKPERSKFDDESGF